MVKVPGKKREQNGLPLCGLLMDMDFISLQFPLLLAPDKAWWEGERKMRMEENLLLL